MTAFKHIPYKDVYRYLENMYPSTKGWIISLNDIMNVCSPDFVIERKFNSKVQKAVVKIIQSTNITQDDVEELERLVIKLSGNNVEIVEKILVIPIGTNISKVPLDINIIYLESKVSDKEPLNQKIINYDYSNGLSTNIPYR